MLICQIAKKCYFFIKYENIDAYMPNSEKNAIFLSNIGIPICQIAKKNAIFLSNMEMLICQIAKKKTIFFLAYKHPF